MASSAGRPRKPTALRRLEGNPGKRALPKNEPKFVGAKGSEPPEWLLPEAAEEWRRIGPELEAIGLLPRASLRIFAGYCQAYAHWMLAEKWLAEHGRTMVMRDKDGKVTGVKEVPQSVIARNERDQMRRLASEFGLTPSTAAGVSAPGKPQSDSPFGDLELIQ